MTPWLVLQLGDSAFPTGGFAHSAGLEAAVQLGEVATSDDLDAFLSASIWQVALGALPFVGAGHAAREGEDAASGIAAADGAADAFLLSHVANRASRTQGRALAATCARVFDEPRLRELDELARARTIHAHHAPLFGAITRDLGLARRQAAELYAHLALRGVASAAVRLGIVGPHEGQRMVRRHHGTLDAAVTACEGLPMDEAAQPAPLLDLFGAAHDGLYSRLFQS